MKSPVKLKLVGGSPLNYPPPQRINHAVPGAEWPFTATTKSEGDVVISALAPTETGTAETENTGSARKGEGGKSSKRNPA